MTVWYELLEDNTIGMSTPSEKVAKNLGKKSEFQSLRENELSNCAKNKFRAL